jgi:uncharacterized surface protein with fasciclin (FAS1) repeats
MGIRGLAVLALTVVVGAACAEGPLETGSEALMARGGGQSLKAAASPTVVDVALAANAQTGEFSTLIAAVVAADMVGVLSAVGQRTVFAPTDAAFAELGLDKDNIATALPVETLRAILSYHVANGRRLSGDVVSADRIRMLSGGFTHITVTGDGAFINDAGIVAVDIEASNGVIHVINAVLIP